VFIKAPGLSIRVDKQMVHTMDELNARLLAACEKGQVAVRPVAG
jgi:hypothetical protein